MRRLLVVALATILLSGCASLPDRDNHILIGSGLGAGVGALIGSASGGPPGGWAGAAIGSASGAVIGSLVKHKACYFRNKRGELWQIPCEDPRVKYAEACFVGNWLGGYTEVSCKRR